MYRVGTLIEPHPGSPDSPRQVIQPAQGPQRPRISSASAHACTTSGSREIAHV